MKTIYLGGPINACTDSEAKDWREDLKERLKGKFNFFDPMSRDYRGRELEPGISTEIVVGDKEDIRNSDIILVFSPKPSVGTSMETFFAFEIGKTVLAVHPPDRPSPWLLEHTTKLVRSFDDAVAYLGNL